MRVLFLGEGDASGPARYLSAVLRWAKIPFDHRPDEFKIPKTWRKKRYDAVILSDYRHSSWTPCAKEWMIEQVTLRGTGFLMIGGWASFTGLVGGYGETDIGRLLPVTCVPKDDRVQNATGALLFPSSVLRSPSPASGEGKAALPSPALSGRGWHSSGEGSFPIVCGYHRATPKKGTEVPYVFRDVIYKNGKISLGRPQPALVLGPAGRARTAAFLTDCAPHWAGGLVDWGRRRVTVPLRRQDSVELGDRYLCFFRDLIKWTAFLSLIFALMTPATLRASRTETLQSSGWLVYWDEPGGLKTINDLHGRLDEICLFAYNFNSDGHLVPGSDDMPDQLQSLKSRQLLGKPRLWVTVVNDKVGKDPVLYKDPVVVHQALADTTARQNHIQELLEASKGADGLEIDYENLDPADRSAFTQFLSELAPLLHARKQLLSVVLEPRTEKQEKTEGPSAMDWVEIGQSADRVRVMAYFLHYTGGDAGPTSPPEWVSEILQFAQKRVPPKKLDIAFCVDGIDWPSKGAGTELSDTQIQDLRKKYNASRLRDGRGEPPHFSYQEGQTIHHVWYEDAESLKEKVHLVQAAHLTRVSFWRLGDGDPNFWKWLAAQKGNAKPKK